jgi:hypothetical protein
VIKEGDAGVDGRLPGPTSNVSYRLTPGRHVLTVAEAIDTRQFDALHLAQRGRTQRDPYKKIELDVRPGVTYRLAAQFDPKLRHQIRSKAYWNPVIWKEVHEPCV